MQVPGGAAGHYLLGLIYRFLLRAILLSKFLYDTYCWLSHGLMFSTSLSLYTAAY